MPVINGISKIYRGDFMLVTHHYQFSKRMEMHDITATVKKDVQQSQIQEGIVVVYTPHTTAGITVNENADNASQTFIIHQGRIILGTWQGIYLCEFDGPRKRTFYVKIIEG